MIDPQWLRNAAIFAQDLEREEDLGKMLEEDCQEYLDLCKKYNEKPLFQKNGTLDCYSKHANKLRERNEDDNLTVSAEPIDGGVQDV